MEAEEPQRPQTARKDSRKVPGGFGTDDEDDLSPAKPIFQDDSVWNKKNAHISNSNRVPSLDMNKLPALPAGDSSYLYAHTDNGGGSEGHNDSLDEREMQRHLMDVESSFINVPSPIGTAGDPGVDDTYLFDGVTKPGAGSLRTHSRAPNKQATVADTSDRSPSSPDTPPAAYQTPGLRRSPELSGDATDDPGGNTTSSLETMSSSPTVAAAARTISRALTVASIPGYETANDRMERESGNDSEDYEATPKKPRRTFTPHGDSSDERSTVRHHDSNRSLKPLATDAGNTPGVPLLNRRSSGRRPKFLRSRNASQRSSTSSFITNPEQDDMILGTDYALQSGGAVPDSGLGLSRSNSFMLSRTISLGSMASGLDDSLEGRPADRTLATLDEEERNRGRDSNNSRGPDSSPPATPRARSQSLAGPTDTVIARHVRNVHVPDSVAKEYRNNTPKSPSMVHDFSAPSMGRNGKNMTLKEQSSTIERLSKENFDLKLKVMFLSDRLDKLSEEGIKEMISENVELKTGLANMQRDNKSLRRKVKELERKLKEEEGRPSTARSTSSSDDRNPTSFDRAGEQEREEELIYLRERVEDFMVEIEKMRVESILREAEKRKLAEVIRTMGERRGEQVDAREEMDVWKDLLEQETARREEADEDNSKLRDEVFRLKTETTVSTGATGLNHTTNIYNITKKRQFSPSRPRSGESESRVDDRTGTFSAASTLVEELRKESEQLRHENAELRREVGAQTSMLTSRNREKERLYQEIEDLKLAQRRGGGSIAGESIFERSASRAHERSNSRTSITTRQTGLVDAERDDLENKNSELRDKIISLKLQNQELQRELETCMEDFEVAVESKKEVETLARELQDELEAVETDLQTMQADRDEALKGQEELENEFENLRKEAQEEIDALEGEAEQKNEDFHRLEGELADRTENFNALQGEMRALSEGLVRLEDDHDVKMRRIQELEQELEEANRELEEMEKSLIESNGKINRLTVQQESSQGEIAFLREEQDGDKIKIGDLEAAIKNAEDTIHDERERARELEQRLANERHQRELVAGKEKQEVQNVINDLNREVSGAKDDARRLRKNLTSREVEATEWKERLMELENNLREALGDLSGTRSSLLKSIAKLQRELENTVRDLDSTRASLTEKDRLIQHRDALLESHGLESRRLSDMLDKERQAHRSTKHQHESFLKTHQHTTRTVSQQESRVLELETGRQLDRKKITFLENNFKDQMTERNNLLLTLWNRLSAICGSDWAHDNSLINGRALPSLEAVSTMLPGFSKNLLFAIKTIETLVGNFKIQVRTVEKDLWKQYQELEHTLEQRTKKLDRLETVVKSGVSGANGPPDTKSEIAKLRELNHALKAELTTLRSSNLKSPTRALASPNESPSPSPSVPTGPRKKSSYSTERTSTLTRHHSTATVDSLERASSSSGTTLQASANEETGEQRWIYRLRELERRLKAEREARLQDRNGARKRLEEGEKQNEELRAELERNRIRKESVLN